MDQLSVDNALRDIKESEPPLTGTDPATASPPASVIGPAGEAVAMATVARPGRSVCVFGDLTGTQLRVLANIVRQYANQLYEFHLHFNETGANDARIKELCAETSEILHVCAYEAYLKQKSENEASGAQGTAARPTPA